MAIVPQASLTNDQEKYLAAKLIENTLIRLVCVSICDPVEMDDGKGITANFVRYRRMNVPVATLTEGSDPVSSTFSTDTVSVTLDQWGDILEVTDIAELSVKHPLMAQLVDLLADNAQRVIDREVQLVWLAGTNVIFGDASVTSRRTITTAMVANTKNIMRVRVQLVDQGAPPRQGPGSVGATNNTKVVAANESSMYSQGGHYVALCGPQVMADIVNEANATGSWVVVHQYNEAKNVYNYEIGTWLGFRWIESNFLPKFTLFGNNTIAVVSGSAFGTGTPTVTALATGGTLAGATGFFFKVTRKDLLRGFEESISIEHTMTSAASASISSFTFAMPATAGFVYNVYFGSTTGDANLKLGAVNVVAGATATITAVPTGVSAPDNILATAGPTTVHPIFFHAAGSTAMVKLQNLQTFITVNNISTYGNILRLKRAAGYKFMMKAMIKNQERVLRNEFASVF